MGKAERARKARAAESRSNAMAVPRPPSHPEPIYAALCAERGYAYNGPEWRRSPTPLVHDDQWYMQDGWPPVPFWISDLGNWFQWDGMREEYVRADDLDPVPPHLKAQIMESIHQGDHVWAALDMHRRFQPLGGRVARHGNLTIGTVTLRTILDAEPAEHHDTDGHRARAAAIEGHINIYGPDPT